MPRSRRLRRPPQRRGCRSARRRGRARPQQGRHRLDADLQRARADDVDSRPRAVLRRPRAHQEHGVGPDAGLHDRRRWSACSGRSTAIRWPSATAALNALIGGFCKAFLKGVDANSTAPTFSNGVVIPELAYFVFQMTFAMITPALIVGAFAERMKFSAVMLFILLWVTFIYFPIAHWVWYVADPDDVAAAAKALAAATTDAAKTAAQAKLDAVTRCVGWLAGAGALDFAGGTVVHINAGIAGLVGALIIGKRIGYGKEAAAAAFADHDDDRRLAAVGRLVRLQRRLQPRSQRHDGAGLRQHDGRHRRRGAVLAAVANGSSRASPRCSASARARSRVSSRSRRPRASPVRSARWCSASSSRRSACSSSPR